MNAVSKYVDQSLHCPSAKRYLCSFTTQQPHVLWRWDEGLEKAAPISIQDDFAG